MQQIFQLLDQIHMLPASVPSIIQSSHFPASGITSVESKQSNRLPTHKHFTESVFSSWNNTSLTTCPQLYTSTVLLMGTPSTVLNG